MLESRWQKLMHVLQFGENKSAFLKLKEKYQEKHRAYHNLHHIKDCLTQLDKYEGEIIDKDIIELSIWYHDIIYNPYGKENELKSAVEASLFLKPQNADAEIIQKVNDTILSTLHTESPKNSSEALIMDIDITILGSSETQYEEYCTKIRKEYKWIPGIIYRKKRKEVMERFLLRDRLYFTDFYHLKLEEKARLNIAQEIQNLS